jgi:hypothetical protein
MIARTCWSPSFFAEFFEAVVTMLHASTSIKILQAAHENQNRIAVTILQPKPHCCNNIATKTALLQHYCNQNRIAVTILQPKPHCCNIIAKSCSAPPTHARSHSAISFETLPLSFFIMSLSDAHQFSEMLRASTLPLYRPSFWGAAVYSMYALRLEARTVTMPT